MDNGDNEHRDMTMYVIEWYGRGNNYRRYLGRDVATDLKDGVRRMRWYSGRGWCNILPGSEDTIIITPQDTVG
jgi:hypothetical protein